jgi:hypothetical protein
MNQLLWPASIGYFLEQMFDGAFLGGPGQIERVRALFVERVRSRGPLPTVRVGRNPYGVLPVAPIVGWEAADDGVDPGLVSILLALRVLWQGDVAEVPRVTADADDQTMTRVLAMAPVSTSFVGRSVIGASYASYLNDFLRRPLDGPWWTAQRARAFKHWVRVLPERNSRAARLTYAESHFVIGGPVAQAVLDDVALAPNYLAALGDATRTLAELRDVTELEGGTPLLFRIARHAALAS